MDLVVDDEPPVVGVQQVQVRVDAFAASGEHLVGGDRDGADLLARAGVLADLLLGQGGEADELLLPLTRRDRVGDQDERRRRALGHGGGAHEGLAGPAGQDDHARAPRPEALHRLALVGAQLEGAGGVGQGDGVGLAVDVAGQVLGRPAQLDEHLLEVAALRGVDDDVGLSEPGPQQALGALGAHDLLQDRHVGGVQDQAVGGVGEQLEAAVAAHRLGDLGEQGVRHREARVGDERVDDRLRVQARGARVPQGQRRDPVGVDVLGGALQLGEGGDGAAGLPGLGVGDLQEDGLVGLDDERAVGRRGHRGRRIAGRGRHVREYPKPGQRAAVTEETFLFQREGRAGRPPARASAADSATDSDVTSTFSSSARAGWPGSWAAAVACEPWGAGPSLGGGSGGATRGQEGGHLRGCVQIGDKGARRTSACERKPHDSAVRIAGLRGGAVPLYPIWTPASFIQAPHSVCEWGGGVFWCG